MLRLTFFVWIALLVLPAQLHKIATRCAHFQPIVLVHGGAGDIIDAKIPIIKFGVKQAAQRGYKALKEMGTVVDAVQQAVNVLEANPNFNAGNGSVLTWEGEVEMDAAIMNGADLKAGCVSLARDIMHPISLARCIMEKTPHNYLAGKGAMQVAKNNGFKILESGSLVTKDEIEALKKFKMGSGDVNTSPGTVGAVAIDACGNVAAATSTGGLTGKLPGRIGDSPLLGAGTYADNERGAVSATGHGESIMRFNLVSRVLALMHYTNCTMQQAAEQMLKEMTSRFRQEAGVIAIDHRGQVGIYFTTTRMPWAYQRENELHCGVEPGEDHLETVD